MDKIKYKYDEHGFDFHWSFGDYEINTLKEKYSNREYRYDNDSEINKNIPVELVKWDPEHKYCWTVALWRRTNEDTYELHFIGSRPFDDIAPDEIAMIWEQLQAAQGMLDMYARATREY